MEHFSEARAQVLRHAQKACALRDKNGEHDWIKENWRLICLHLPEVAEYMEGQAEALGIGMETMIASLHGDVLNTRDRLAPPPPEECSTFAFPLEGSGVLVAKNRDNPPGASDRHTIAIHRDPAWATDWVVAISSVGSAMTASSAMNSHGLIMVCNACHHREVGQGLLKAWITDVLLTRCQTVQEALAFLQKLPLMGEGNLIFGDRTGCVAAVALLARGAIVEEAPSDGWVARTNHLDGEKLASLNLFPADDLTRGRNTRGRLGYLRQQLASLPLPWKGGWPKAQSWAMEQLAFCEEGNACSLSLDHPHVYTASGAIFGNTPPSLIISEGPPDRGLWRIANLPATRD